MSIHYQVLLMQPLKYLPSLSPTSSAIVPIQASKTPQPCLRPSGYHPLPLQSILLVLKSEFLKMYIRSCSMLKTIQWFPTGLKNKTKHPPLTQSLSPCRGCRLLTSQASTHAFLSLTLHFLVTKATITSIHVPRMSWAYFHLMPSLMLFLCFEMF